MSKNRVPRESIQISLVQTDPVWEEVDQNLSRLEGILTPLTGQTDVVVLPEMFSTGFTMNAPILAETMEGSTVPWLQQMSERIHAAITGSIIVKSGGKYLNRLLWITPGLPVCFYDKRHLFRMGEEVEHYSPGFDKVITWHEGWAFRPLICYDLRFPVWSRNRQDYDVLIYVANWPATRKHVWKALLIARALENQCYVAGVNRIGTDGRGISYAGESMLIDPKGNILTSIRDEETIESISISYKELADFRDRFPVHQDADSFEIFP
jgi:omega-amidase